MQSQRFPRRYLAVVLCAFIGASLSGCGGGGSDPGGGGTAQSLATLYSVVDLGVLPDSTSGDPGRELHSSVLRVNTANHATGAFRRFSNGETHAFLFTGLTPPTDIGTLGGLHSLGVGMNEASTVVGASNLSDGTLVAFMRTIGGEMTPLDTLASRADGINNPAGPFPQPMIVGSLLDSAGVLTATTWVNGVRTDLPKDIGGTPFNRSGATDVNDSRQIAGEMHNAVSDFQAVLWDSGIAFAIPSIALNGPVFSTTFARAINNFGQIVGFGATPGNPQQAFLWTPSGPNATTGSTFALPGLGGSSSIAFDVSSAGIVVGTSTNGLGQRRAVAWTPSGTNSPDGAITDLTSRLVPGDSGWTIEFATSITDGGQAIIVGWGRSPSGQAQRAVMLVPQ